MDVDELHVDKLQTVPVNLTKLGNVVDNDAVKKAEYNKLVTKLNSIDTGGPVLKTQNNTDKSGLEKKLMILTKTTPNTSALVKKINGL